MNAARTHKNLPAPAPFAGLSLPEHLGAFFCALFFLFLTTAGCIPEITCLDIGCPAGQTCNTTTLTCEIPLRDCMITGCPAGQRCDEQQNICRPDAVSCRNQSCGHYQTCNTQTGFCETTADCTTSGCASNAETCDTVSGLCVALSCSSDATCPGGFVCGDTGRCIAGCRLDGRACAQGQYCRIHTGDSLGQCVPQCIHDTDCPFGQRCELHNDRATCQLEAACEHSDNCRDDEICLDSLCTQPPCASDSDCPGTQTCNRSTGICLDAACDEDIFAPNHAPNQSALLAPGNYTRLTLCPGRDDWFSIDVRSSDAVRLRINHAGDNDIDAYLFDADGRLLAANQRLNPAIYLDHVATRAQTLRLQLVSTSYQTTSYSVYLTLNEDRFCSDDDFEENDSIHQATRLPTTPNLISELPLRICGYDEDWFVLPDLSANQGLRVRFRNAPGDFVGHLLTPDGAVIQPPLDQDLQLTRLGSAGDYHLHARSLTGQSATYRMLVEVLPPWQCTPESHPNTTRATASLLPASTTQPLTLCPTDTGWNISWFALEPPSGPSADATLHLELHPERHESASTHTPALHLTLFELIDDSPTVLRTAVPQADGSLRLQTRFTNDAAHPLYIRVSSPDPVGRAFTPPGYQLSYTWELPESPNREDDGEDPPPTDN